MIDRGTKREKKKDREEKKLRSEKMKEFEGKG
jgi:hypothetical protein